jgi:hypothetical protein
LHELFNFGPIIEKRENYLKLKILEKASSENLQLERINEFSIDKTNLQLYYAILYSLLSVVQNSDTLQHKSLAMVQFWKYLDDFSANFDENIWETICSEYIGMSSSF